MMKPSNRIQAIYDRRSVRSFQAKAIPEESLYEIIHAATRAPASGNMQPWEFVIVDEPALKQSLVEQTFSGFYSKEGQYQAWILEASVVCVACSNMKRTIARYGDLAYQWAPLDTANAVQNLLLAASNLGISSCWVGGFREQEVKDLLGLPSYVKPIGLIPLGYATTELAAKAKLDPEWVTHRNRYHHPYFTKE